MQIPTEKSVGKSKDFGSDQSHASGGLTRVKSCFFFSIKLSRSDDSNHGFGRLTWIIFYVFF